MLMFKREKKKNLPKMVSSNRMHNHLHENSFKTLEMLLLFMP